MKSPLIMVLSTGIKCVSSLGSASGIYNGVFFNSLFFLMHICVYLYAHTKNLTSPVSLTNLSQRDSTVF